jgi:hypothetical protein
MQRTGVLKPGGGGGPFLLVPCRYNCLASRLPGPGEIVRPIPPKSLMSGHTSSQQNTVALRKLIAPEIDVIFV